MKDGHTTHGESSFGKKLWCVLIVVFLGGMGWQMWKLHAYNNAVREAKEAGFEWRCEDTLSLIKQDWHNALKKETWGAHSRVLEMGEVPDLGHYREMLHHLNPTDLSAEGCKDENLDVIKGLTALQKLWLYGCTALQNVDILKSLPGLRTLGLGGSPTRQNTDDLKGFTNLQAISLGGCPALQNLDGLKSIPGLKELDLNLCDALQNVDALKSLIGLQMLNLYWCDKIPAAALRELRAALPNTEIIFPDGTENPPQ